MVKISLKFLPINSPGRERITITAGMIRKYRIEKRFLYR